MCHDRIRPFPEAAITAPVFVPIWRLDVVPTTIRIGNHTKTIGHVFDIKYTSPILNVSTAYVQTPQGLQRTKIAHRTAHAALKHSFEKVGDHWEPKKKQGSSDPRSKKKTAQKQRGEGETFGGVDVEGNSKKHLYERANRLGIKGRSKMSKTELARAIANKQ